MTQDKALATQVTGTLTDPMEFFRQRGVILTERRKLIHSIIHDPHEFVPGVDWVAIPGVTKPVINPKTGDYVKDGAGKFINKPCRMLSKPGSENMTTRFILTVEQEEVEAEITPRLIRVRYKAHLYDTSGHFTGVGPNTLIAEREATASSMEPKWRYRWVRVGPQPQGAFSKKSGEKMQMVRKMLGDKAEPDAMYAVKKVEGEWCAVKRIDNDNVLALEHDIRERAQKRAYSAVVRIGLNISNEFDDDMANPGEMNNEQSPPGIAKTTYEDKKPKKKGRPTSNKAAKKEEPPLDPNVPLTEQEKIAIEMIEMFDSYNIAHDVGWAIVKADFGQDEDTVTDETIIEVAKRIRAKQKGKDEAAGNGLLT